jgi:hypothetical protein
MITKDDLLTAGIAEDKATEVLTILGENARLFTPENVGKKAFDEVDLSVLNLTKIPKNGNEKTTDYLKRAQSEFLNKSIEERTNELNGKIKEAEEKLKNHKGDETLKAELQALKDEKNKLPDLKNEWIKEYKEKAEKIENDFNSFKKQVELRNEIKFKFKNEIPSYLLDIAIDKALEKAVTGYDKFEKGSDGLYLVDSVKVDKIKASSFFETELKDIIDNGQRQTGGGAGGGQQGVTKSKYAIDLNLKPGEKVNLIKKNLIEVEGLDPLHKDWDKRFKEEFDANNIKFE